MDGSAVTIALKSRKRRHNQTFWLKYMLKKKRFMMGLLLLINIFLLYLNMVNTSKVKDVELLSVQGNNSGDTLNVIGMVARIVAAMNMMVNSCWNPRHYLTLNVVQSMKVITLNF